MSPSAHTGRPGASDTDMPPSAHTGRPVASDTDMSPSAHTGRPEASDTERPQASDTERPGASDTDMPPSAHAGRPEASDTDMSPSAHTGRPEASDTERPEASDTDMSQTTHEYTVLNNAEIEESFSEDSGSEYLPDSETSDTASIDYPMLVPEGHPKLNVQRKTVKTIPNNDIFIRTTNNMNGDRVYDKKYFCPYCRTKQAKLPRHLETKHQNEIDVAKYLNEKDKWDKKKLMLKIRNMGSFLNNKEVIERGSGELIVAYRPNTVASWTDYSPCEHCLGYYVEKELWQHYQRCFLGPKKQHNGRILQRIRLLKPCPSGTSLGIRTLMSTMRLDQVGLCCKSDELIQKLGEKMFQKHGHDREQFPFIRNKLRELGRLLLQLRGKPGSENASLKDFINPSSFLDLVSAAKAIAGFEESTHRYATPSIALNLGGSLKKCANIVKRDAIISQNDDQRQQATYFNELVEMEWLEEVNSHAYRSLTELRRNSIKFIPLVNDTVLLSNHLRTTGQTAFNQLKMGNNENAWDELNSATLARVVLFNRRRQGEASKMTISDYHCIHKVSQDNLKESLAPLERKLCEKLKRVEIVGKRGRIVPVILTQEINDWINLLLEERHRVGVHEDNKYVFARRNCGSQGHIRASDVIREASSKCGAERPELLRSTKLRKQIGTLSQILNLRDNELDILANFLGHDIRVHREFYRLPEETVQVAKVSKILLALEKGTLHLQTGKSLDDVRVDLDEEIDIDGEKSDSEDEELEAEKGKTEHKKTNRTKRPLPDRYDEDEDDEDEVMPRKRRNLTKRKPWTESEKTAVFRHFQTSIFLKRLPGRRQIDACMNAEAALQNRTWKNIKDFIRNQFNSKRS